MADLAAVNAVCMNHLRKIGHKKDTHQPADIATVSDPKPARVCVAVAELGRGAKVSHNTIRYSGLIQY